MREIKFRTFYKDENILYRDVDISNECLPINDDNVVIMQYTGLKDKNGVEIYEGDIVKIGIDFGYCTQPLVGEVLFDKCSFVYRRKSQGDLLLFGIDSNDWCKVIGNIYENHELLECEE